jgi:hypothetical protein
MSFLLPGNRQPTIWLASSVFRFVILSCSGSDIVMEPEPLVRRRGEGRFANPTAGTINTRLGELREADLHFPSLSIIAIDVPPFMCHKTGTLPQMRQRRTGSVI